ITTGGAPTMADTMPATTAAGGTDPPVLPPRIDQRRVVCFASVLERNNGDSRDRRQPNSGRKGFSWCRKKSLWPCSPLSAASLLGASAGAHPTLTSASTLEGHPQATPPTLPAVRRPLRSPSLHAAWPDRIP